MVRKIFVNFENRRDEFVTTILLWKIITWQVRHTYCPVILLECLQKSVWSQTEICWKWKTNIQWFMLSFLYLVMNFFWSSSRKNKYHHKHPDKQSICLAFCFSIVFQNRIVVYATLWFELIYLAYCDDFMWRWWFLRYFNNFPFLLF